jgi:large subunit ribosomal protein L21
MFILEVPKIYAIVETGGKQYRITEGETVDVEDLKVAEGSTVEIEKVLLIADDDNVIVGKPAIEGAKVTATAQSNGRGKKIIVFKYKPKVRYRRKLGHRQPYTRLVIDRIAMPGATEETKAKRTRRTKKEVTEDGA